MRIGIPLANGSLALHFGHCERFAIVEADEAAGTVGETQELTPPAHEPGVLPRWLAEQGVTVIIAGGMGQRAQTLFSQQGIRAIVGAPAAPPEALVKALLDGTLQPGENLCDH